MARITAFVNIIATQGTKTDNQHQKKKDKERKQINSFHNSTLESPDKRSKKTTKTLISSLFSQNHRVMDWVKFKQKTATKRQNFAKKLKLCFNCLSRAHMLKNGSRSLDVVSMVVGKNHTLLHKEPLDNNEPYQIDKFWN